MHISIRFVNASLFHSFVRFPASWTRGDISPFVSSVSSFSGPEEAMIERAKLLADDLLLVVRSEWTKARDANALGQGQQQGYPQQGGYQQSAAAQAYYVRPAPRLAVVASLCCPRFPIDATSTASRIFCLVLYRPSSKLPTPSRSLPPSQGARLPLPLPPTAPLLPQMLPPPPPLPEEAPSPPRILRRRTGSTGASSFISYLRFSLRLV